MSSTDSTASVELTEERRAFIDGLRDLAEFLEAHAEIPATFGMIAVANVNRYSEEDDDPRDRLARIAATRGRWEKETSGDSFQLVRWFGPHKLIVFAAREAVCERVVVGTETVTRAVPAPDTPPPLLLTEEVEKVEWICPPSFLAGVGA